MNHAAQWGGFLDERADAKGAEDAFAAEASFGDGVIVGNGLAIHALQEVIRRQRDLERSFAWIGGKAA
jgi:hypothetical protein